MIRPTVLAVTFVAATLVGGVAAADTSGTPAMLTAVDAAHVQPIDDSSVRGKRYNASSYAAAERYYDKLCAKIRCVNAYVYQYTDSPKTYVEVKYKYKGNFGVTRYRTLSH